MAEPSTSATQAKSPARDPRDARIDELRRRGRNNLAVVRSMIERSVREDISLDDYVARLIGRIGALSRAQALADAGGHAMADLELLLADEFVVHVARIGERAVLSGPRVHVGGRTAQLLALAAHELASNAATFGALGDDSGQVEVRWARTGDRLRLDWRERLATVQPDLGESGFGHTLLTRVLVYELGAEVSLAIEPQGLVCVIELPLGEDIRIASD